MIQMLCISMELVNKTHGSKRSRQSWLHTHTVCFRERSTGHGPCGSKAMYYEDTCADKSIPG